jgi:peptidoglycan/xylan/chitin deacetylase (PgdA/CDA1 family)
MTVSVRSCLESVFFCIERVITAFLYPLCLLRDRLTGALAIPVLMFHQVGPRPRGARSCSDAVSPERFARQIDAILKAGYDVVSLGHALERLRATGERHCRPVVALTFDDGFFGQLANACPILGRHHLPATFFPIAGFVGSDTPPPHLGITRGPAGGGGEDRSDAPLEAWRPLSWEELRTVAARGFDIGSHSLTHRSLGALTPEELDAEVRRSKAILERLVVPRVDFFAYPFGSEAYGDFDFRVRDRLCAAGYRGACTTVVGRNRPATDPFALRRIPIEESDGEFRIRCKLAGAYDWVGRVKDLWQRRVAREDRVDLPPSSPSLRSAMVSVVDRAGDER